MKTRFPILLLLILLQGIGAVNAQLKNGMNTVLWKIEHPGSTNISYILGTNHLFGEEWVKSHPKIDTLVSSSAIFICESLHSIDTAALTKLQHNLRSEKRTSKELFKEDFEVVNTYFKDKTGSGLVENVDNSSEPRIGVIWRIYDYLLGEIAAKRHIKISGNGDPLDKSLLESATIQKKITVGLDPIEVVNSVYTSANLIDEYCSFIIDLIKIDNHDLLVADTRLGQQSYDRILFGMETYDKAKYDYNFTSKPTKAAMLEKRNKLWMKKLPDLIKSSNCFIAVGAKHLESRIGIIPELQKMGYVISPIDLN